MPIRKLFPTLLYNEPLQARSPRALNAALIADAEKLRDADRAGRAWSKQNYAGGGYTSYGSLSQLHRMSSSFTRLQKLLDAHVARFARELEFDVPRGQKLEMTSCWINMMTRNSLHGLHLHPIATISGTYYVSTPPGGGDFKVEDPRLGLMMAAPPRKTRCREDNQAFVSIEPRAGDVILFESWLRHEVAPNQSNDERVSVSFNYNWF